MGKNFPRPTGQLQGDDRAMPDRGTSTGFNGDTYGADTSPTSTNRMGGISSHTQSHDRESRPGKQNQK